MFILCLVVIIEKKKTVMIGISCQAIMYLSN